MFLNVVRHVGRLLDGIESSRPFEIENLLFCGRLLSTGVRVRFVSLRLKAMLMKRWYVGDRFESWTVWGITGLMRLLTLGVGELLMLGGTFLVYVGVGIMLF